MKRIHTSLPRAGLRVPLHKDKSLNDSFWCALGFQTGVYPYGREMANHNYISVWHNTLPGDRLRYDGYVVLVGGRSVVGGGSSGGGIYAVVRSRLHAAAVVLATLIVYDEVYAPPPPPRMWYIWDDGLEKKYGEFLVSMRRRDNPDHDFILVPSQFSETGTYQIEGSRREV